MTAQRNRLPARCLAPSKHHLFLDSIKGVLAQEDHQYLALAGGVINHLLVAGTHLSATREKAAARS